MQKLKLVKILGLSGIIIIVLGFLAMIFFNEMLVFWISVIVALIMLFIVKKLKKK